MDTHSRATERREAHFQPPADQPIVPLAVKPRAAAAMLSTGLTRIYELLNAGELVSYHDGRSRLITTESLRNYVTRKVSASNDTAPPTAPAAA